MTRNQSPSFAKGGVENGTPIDAGETPWEPVEQPMVAPMLADGQTFVARGGSGGVSAAPPAAVTHAEARKALVLINYDITFLEGRATIHRYVDEQERREREAAARIAELCQSLACNDAELAESRDRTKNRDQQIEYFESIVRDAEKTDDGDKREKLSHEIAIMESAIQLLEGD